MLVAGLALPFSSAQTAFCPPAGEHYRLVQTAQEHGTADDVQRKARPWEAQERPVQPSPDLPAADAQQRNTSRLNPQDGVCRLHLTQQVGVSYSNACVTKCETKFLCMCTFESFNVLHADGSQMFLYWSITWVYWNSCPTGRCLPHVQLQVITSPWRNTGLILHTVEIWVFHDKESCAFCWFSPRFFCSNGFLKEVIEVNKMNDSLQSELQVRDCRRGVLRLCLNVPF